MSKVLNLQWWECFSKNIGSYVFNILVDKVNLSFFNNPVNKIIVYINVFGYIDNIGNLLWV